MSKTIVITGASRGIGRAMVEHFANDASLNIVALSRNTEAMDAAFSTFDNVTSHYLDLAGDDISAQCATAFNELDSIDVLINNAGYLINKPFPELNHQDFATSYQVNVIGVMELTQKVLLKMKTGHIVNISSMGGFQGSVKFPGLAAYSTSKAALCSFTELFAEEYKDSGIQMNCLCLGAVQTEMLEEAFPGYEAPLNPEKMAEFIADFALKGNQWMNGKIIPVSLSTP